MTKRLTLDQKIAAFNEELNPILEKYDLYLSAEIKFPQYNEIPEEVQLALKVINNHKGRLINTAIQRPK